MSFNNVLHKSVAYAIHSATNNATGGSVLLGYARVSTTDQDLQQQREALEQAGCRRLFEENVSGARRDRPELERMLSQLREGDTVV